MPAKKKVTKKKTNTVVKPTTMDIPGNNKMTADSYTQFSIMFQRYMQNVYSPNINFSAPTNWYEEYPGYRVHGYKTIQVSQVMGIYSIMNPQFIRQFDTIIEIGTYNGGLSLWLHDNKKEGAKFVTYDIDGEINAAKKFSGHMDCRVQSCFDESAMEDIQNMIQSEGKVLVLCDGGDKPKEFNTFAAYLKKGDHIMAHDYKREQRDWDIITSYWQWPYATDTDWKDIQKTVDKYDLAEYDRRRFEFALWASFVKR